MDMQSIENTLIEIIDTFAGNLPTEQLARMKDLARAGEPGVAFENLCTQLYEYDVAVGNEILCRLSELGKAMMIDAEYWETLEVLEVPGSGEDEHPEA